MKTFEVQSKLRDRYAGHEWACAFEVSEKTGGGGRRCDCLAMGLWPSKGLYLHGHEIKASRSDWLNEINDPTKAEAFAKRCHYWWIAAPNGIVKLEELPEKWGLMTCGKNTSLRVRRPATKTEPESTVSWPFFASCMRAFSGAGLAEKVGQREYNRGFTDGELWRRYESLKATCQRALDASSRESWEEGEMLYDVLSDIRRHLSADQLEDELLSCPDIPLIVQENGPAIPDLRGRNHYCDFQDGNL